MSEPQRISIVIPAYNAADTLLRAVESLNATAYPNLEVVIVDDGSEDDTWAVATQIADGGSMNATCFRHANGENRGVSATRNLGIERATGELIGFLDADDYVYPHRFEEAVDILRDDETVDGVQNTCELVFSNDESRAAWWNDAPLFGFEQRVAPDALLEELLTGRCWATSAILFRRELLERTGVFSTELQIAEDCHLWFRMASVGRIVAGDPQRPVSAYWRTMESAYQPHASTRILMIRAMTAFLAWARRSPDVPPETLRRARGAVARYITRGVASARGRSDRSDAWSIALKSLRAMPAMALDYRFQRQFAHLMVGR